MLQFTLPGNPSIYYGDEIGMEGFEDPLNRCFFQWEEQNVSLREFYKKLSSLKNQNEAIKRGDIVFREVGDKFIKFTRKWQSNVVYIDVSMEKELEYSGNPILEVYADNIKAVIYN